MGIKILSGLLIFVGIGLSANTLEKTLDGKGGYSYAGIGVSNLTYSESGTSQGQGFSSNVKLTTPVYMTGSYTKINEKYSFSIDAVSTLVTSSSDESFSTNGTLSTTNKFDSSLSEFEILGHYSISKGHKILAGPKYTYFSAKRYQFTNADGSANTQNLSEERISTLHASIGYEFETAPFSSSDLRMKFSSLISKPIWRSASNTGFEKVVFNSTTGYSYELNSYIGYKIIKNLEVGLFGEYSLSKKTGADFSADSQGNNVQWPSNKLQVIRTGFMFLWKF